MDIESLRAFLGWCALINMGVLVFTFVMIVSARDLIYRVYGRWFPMPRETFHEEMFRLLGIHKLLVSMFTVVPYIALMIVG